MLPLLLYNGPKHPFFFGFLTLCVFLHLSLTSLCMSHWCLLVPPFMPLLLYFLLLLLLSLALLLLLPFILLLLFFHALLLLSFMLLLLFLFALCKGQNGQKKIAAVFWYWLHLRPLANLTFSPLTPIPSLNEIHKVMKFS